MLKSETNQRCCGNGQIDTELMRKEYTELQNPPEKLRDCVLGETPTNPQRQKQLQKNLLENSMPLNNDFAMASVHSEHAPAEVCFKNFNENNEK